MRKDILYPLRRLHGWLHEYPQYRRERNALKAPYIQKIKAFQKDNTPFAFLILTPEHGNLGDHAIAHVETELLHHVGLSWIEITGKQLEILKRYKLFGIMNGYPILINGGGNLGTLWIETEQVHRDTIQANPDSSIIILPNTIYYEKTEWGNEELRKSIKIYNRHKHLTIYAREKTSYDFMKDIYKDVRLMPDMVMALQPKIPPVDRHGCLLCLRKDCEKTRTEAQEAEIRRQAAALFGTDMADIDMVISGGIPIVRRAAALKERFAEFASARLVITDRLHGMVFCAITGTPCIVVDSKSPKVRGCYEWIRHLDYIRFADDASEIASVYAEIPDKQHIYDNSHLLPYYDELAKVVKEICRK